MSRCLLLWSKLIWGDRRNGYCKTIALVMVTVLSSWSAFAQEGTVKGRVASGDTALSNVTVQVKGTSVITQTDINGNFSTTAKPGSTLVFSSVGYGTQEVPVNNRTTVDVQLVSANRQLEEVVVVGYGTQRRRDLTGSVSSVSAQQIEKVPVTTLDQSLQGRATGVQVTNNDGAPGGGVQVQIRGI